MVVMHWGFISKAINLNYGQGDETNLNQKKVSNSIGSTYLNRSVASKLEYQR